MKRALIALGIIACMLVATIPPLNFTEHAQAEDLPTFETQSADWWNLNWSYSKKITINHSQVADNLTNFPVCINITDMDLANKAQSDGNDIAFISADNSTQYHHEMELYDNTNGQLVAWVNVTSLSSSSDTTIWMYYGNATCSNQESITDTWDDDFIQVYHYADSDNTNIDDSTDTYEATQSGDIFDEQEGIIGDSIRFGGSNDLVDFTDYDIDSRTYSVWLKGDGGDGYVYLYTSPGGGDEYANLAIILQKDGSNYNFKSRPNNERGGIDSCSKSVPSDEWHHTSFYYNYSDGNYAVYFDGKLKCSGTDTALDTTYDINFFGYPNYNCYDGYADEHRTSTVARSDDWIKTEYNSMNNATDGGFFTLDDEQTPGNQFTAWEYNRSITFNSSQIPNNLINFPVCINITDTHLKNNAQADGDDILFTSDNITKLNHEIELYNSTTGHLVAWVNVTSLSSTEDTVIYMYYDNAACSNQEKVEGVWNGNIYGHVWHMDDETNVLDSTSNSNNGVENGNPIYQQTGKTGYSIYFNTTNPDYFSLSEGTLDDTTGTVMAIFRSPDDEHQAILSEGHTSNSYAYLLWEIKSSSRNGIGTYQRSDESWTGSSISDNSWHICYWRMDDADSKYFVDGEKITPSKENNGAFDCFGDMSGNTWSIGILDRASDFGEFNGHIDELRWCEQKLTDDWIETEYNSMNNATDGGFFELEPMEATNTAPNTPTSPQCQNATWSATNHLIDHTPYFNWTFSDSDTNDTQHGFHIQVTADEAPFGSYMWNYTENTSNEFIIYNGSTLQDGALYNWKVRVKDNDSAWSDYTANQQFRMNSKPSAPLLDTPGDGATGLPYMNDSISLEWHAATDAEDSGSLNYWWQYSRFSDFSSMATEKDGDIGYSTGPLVVTIPQTQELYEQTDYYWRVRAWDGFENGSWSDVWSFETDEIIDLTDFSIPNATENVSVDVGAWAINITHDDGGPFNWWINTTPYIGNSSGRGAENGIKTCQLSGLQYNTTYEVQVVVIGSSRNETYTFTTEEDPDDNIHVTLSPQAEANIEVNRSAWEPSIGITGDIKTDTVWGLLDNNGSITVDVTVNVSNTVNWTAAPTAAHNQFQMQIHNSSWYTIGNTHQTFVENLAYNEDQTFGLQLFMPTSSETNSNQTATITFVATVD